MTARKVDLDGAQWVVLVCSSVFGVVPGRNDDRVGGRGLVHVCGWDGERDMN